MPGYLKDDSVEPVIGSLLNLVADDRPAMPPPGHQAGWEALNAGERATWQDQASSALRRLLDLGAETADLYAFVRGVRALAFAEALSALDPAGEGELAGEFFGAYLEMPDE